MKKSIINYKRNKINKVSAAVLVGIFSCTSAVSFAETTTKDKEIETIVVTGMRGSLLKSLNQKRFSNKIVDVITAEDIGKFPEANLSEAIQRIPGVTLNRNRAGEGVAINLRGLGPEFSSTEVNGMSAGGSGGTRGFSFDIFPAELFSSVEVSKSVTADQVEGGIAGSISLSTPEPLSSKETVFNVSLSSSYSENSKTNSPKASVVFNKNWNDTFGINAALVYSDKDLQSNAVRGSSWTPLSRVWKGPDVGAAGGPTQEEYDALFPRIESFSHSFTKKETLGAALTAQWTPSDELNIVARYLRGENDSDFNRTIYDAPSESNITAVSNAVIKNGVAQSGTLTGVQQRVGTRGNIINEEVEQFTLSADWVISDNLTFSPYIGSFTRDESNTTDLFSFRRAGADGEFSPADVNFINRGDFLEWSTPGTDFASNPEEFVLNIFIRRPIVRKDENTTLKFDFNYDDGDRLTVDFGMRLTDRDLSQDASGASDLAANAENGDGSDLNRLTDLPTLADVFIRQDNFNVDGTGSFAPSTLLGVDRAKALATFYNADGTAIDGTRIIPNETRPLSNSFKLNEETLAIYAQANIEVSDDLTINTGLRFIKTDQTIGTVTTTDRRDPAAYSDVSLKSDYQEVLPNLNVRYQINDDLIVRGSYFKSLTRPALGELAGSENFTGIDSGGGKGSRGNPELTPFTADNYDLGLEWYFAPEAVASVNFFYKDLDGFIDTSSFTEDRTFPRQSDQLIVTGPIIFSQPANGVAATINGIEVAYQSRLGFISDSLDNFGVLVNYTAISSAAQFSNEGDIRNSGLPGLSETSYNFALFYDVTDFEARLSYTWRDDYLKEFASTAGIPRFQDASGQLDFSANYSVTEKLQLQLSGINLTKEQELTRSQGNAPYGLVQIDRRIEVGVRYAF